MNKHVVETEQITRTTLRPIACLNDYVAIIMEALVKPSSGIELPQNAKIETKFKNEGIVAGIGPDIPAGLIALGDKVILRGNQYLQLKPENGPYKGMVIAMVHKLDLVCKVDPAECPPCPYVFTS